MHANPLIFGGNIPMPSVYAFMIAILWRIALSPMRTVTANVYRSALFGGSPDWIVRTPHEHEQQPPQGKTRWTTFFISALRIGEG